MLRKIVNLLMGAPEGSDLNRTHFELLLDEVREGIREQLSEGRDPLEVLAQAVMSVSLDSDAEVDPQAARAYFSVLVENERLPLGEQLEAHELELLRGLLNDYFRGDEEVRMRANEVLSLIERKFSQGAFSQARILLQIFETDHETRLNNERNLFYEDSIMRLGVRRRHEVDRDERDDIRKRFSTASIVRDADLKKLLGAISKEYYIKLCLAQRDPAAEETWQDLFTAHPEAAERLLRYVPPVRWRSVDTIEGLSVFEQSRLYLSPQVLQEHILRLIKMAYFLLLASGDTGFEDYIYCLTEWMRSHLDIAPLRVLPRLHRRSVLDELSLREVLDELYLSDIASAVEERVDISEKKLKAAWMKLFAAFATMDINEIPPGHYDLSGFLLDQVLDFKQPEPYFGFKLYRLS